MSPICLFSPHLATSRYLSAPYAGRRSKSDSRWLSPSRAYGPPSTLQMEPPHAQFGRVCFVLNVRDKPVVPKLLPFHFPFFSCSVRVALSCFLLPFPRQAQKRRYILVVKGELHSVPPSHPGWHCPFCRPRLWLYSRKVQEPLNTGPAQPDLAIVAFAPSFAPAVTCSPSAGSGLVLQLRFSRCVVVIFSKHSPFPNTLSRSPLFLSSPYPRRKRAHG